MSDALSKKERDQGENKAEREKDREQSEEEFHLHRHSKRKSTREFMRPSGETGHTSGGERAPRTYGKIIRQSELRAEEAP